MYKRQADTSLEYLQNYINDDISSLGTIKEADLEAVMACEPDVIFIGGRLASSYDALSEIAPVVYLATDTELGVVESVRRNAMTIASMFGLEDKVDELMAGFNSRIAALDEFSAGKTAILSLIHIFCQAGFCDRRHIGPRIEKKGGRAAGRAVSGGRGPGDRGSGQRAGRGPGIFGAVRDPLWDRADQK